MELSGQHKYELISQSDESCVIAEYEREQDTNTAYQSEAQLEQEFIAQLQKQAYEYIHIKDEKALIQNLRTQLEKLNSFEFTDSQWQRYFTEVIAKKSDGVTEKAIRIQRDYVHTLTDDNGKPIANIKLIDKQDIHNNTLQVINQYAVKAGEGGATRNTRFDVTVLVNGLPLVHIELKKRGISLREAFGQIKRYGRDSFWADNGLFDYTQLFVISNGTQTKYYSNTTRQAHLKNGLKQNRGGAAFEFTSWWADARNQKISDLRDFTKTFFAKHSLLALLTRYCILTADNTLLAMRPYQIAATERILQKINSSINTKTLGTTAAGGYIWHTTGSGKTLTSFKTAQLACAIPEVEKVLFVVDRKDLDYQTMNEYDKFEKGAANSNASTAILRRQMADPNAKIIITTIQKLSNFVQEDGHDIYQKHVVMIFDECHRSQFGQMHRAIIKKFKKYNLFGFTGTPIFKENAGSGAVIKTTEQVFGDKLHTYTVVDAIADKNVLPFKLTNHATVVQKSDIKNEQIAGIDQEAALLHQNRVKEITEYILDNYARLTKRTETYEHTVVTNVAETVRRRNKKEAVKGKRTVKGANALFAVSSIEAAKIYYNQFSSQQKDKPEHERLKIATIFSYAPNEEVTDSFDEEGFDTAGLDASSRDFLEDAINDYNDTFGTSWSTDADGFQSYYKDLSMRLKNREIDLAIVVNMFLTGFDAPTMNTLFVDKNLKMHGLIQAFSRTNRILNSTKTHGNIESFRNLEEETNEALQLFGNKDARSMVLIESFDVYYAKYLEKIEQLKTQFPLGEDIISEEAQKEFVKLYGGILRLQNILVTFDEFEGNERITEREKQDYQSVYLEIYDNLRGAKDNDSIDISDDLEFELEIINQFDINIDYILALIEKWKTEHKGDDTIEIRDEIRRKLESSPGLRDKADLINAFIDNLNGVENLGQQLQEFMQGRYEAELATLISEERLKPEACREFMARAIETGQVQVHGTEIVNVMPPMGRFGASAGQSAATKTRIIAKMQALIERFGMFVGGNTEVLS